MDWISAAIAGGSAIAGGAVVAISNYWVRRADIRESRRTELRAAVVDYLHMVDLIGLEASRQPKSGRSVRALNRFIEQRAPQIDYTTGRLHEAIFTPHLRRLMDRLSFATNRLLMVAPFELLAPMEDVNVALADFEGPDPDWNQRWEDARKRFAIACRELVGPEEKPARYPNPKD
jgi:hypothetical protein